MCPEPLIRLRAHLFIIMIILALGTNLGHRHQNLEEAIRHLGRIGRVTRRSSILETDPVGFASSNRFLNMAVAIETPLSPMELLDATQQIERRMGRTEKSRNGIHHDRIIDIDLIDYNGLSVNNERLVLPHPRAGERDFVRIPVAELMGQ